MEMGLEAASIEDLPSYIGKAEVILVATHSAEPLILRSHLESGDKKLIIDLSIPCNVEDSVRSLSNVTLINVDDLSKIKDKTLQRREAELPKATEIISRHLAEFNEWITLRKNVPVLTAVKSKLYAMQSCDMFINYSAQNKIPVVKENNSHKMIQQVINITANQMRTQNKGGCNFIEAINEFLEAVKN